MKSDKNTIGTLTTTTKDNQLLIDVPVTVNYSIGLGKNVAITPFVGPMVTFALSGKTTVTTNESITNTNHENTMDWYGDDAMLKRFNLAVLGGVNVKYVRLNLFCGYQMGLLDIDTYDATTTKTSGFFLGLGYDL